MVAGLVKLCELVAGRLRLSVLPSRLASSLLIYEGDSKTVQSIDIRLPAITYSTLDNQPEIQGVQGLGLSELNRKAGFRIFQTSIYLCALCLVCSHLCDICAVIEVYSKLN